MPKKKMLKIVEITKYFHDDPVKQAASDAMAWTGVWDVCPPVGRGQVRFLRYLEVEDAYVSDIVSILSDLKIYEMEISNVKILKRARGVPGAIPSNLSSGKRIGLENLGGIIRANLRWQLECRLSAGTSVFVVFGDDMYVYVGIRGNQPIQVKPSNDFISHRDVSDRVIDRERFYWGKKAS